jgi:hypothetical protein
MEQKENFLLQNAKLMFFLFRIFEITYEVFEIKQRMPAFWFK